MSVEKIATVVGSETTSLRARDGRRAYQSVMKVGAAGAPDLVMTILVF
jgi:hypothetical protein